VSSARRPPQGPGSGATPPTNRTRVRITRRGWVTIGALVLAVAVLVVWGVIAAGGDHPTAGHTTSSSTTTSPSTVPASTTTPETSPAVAGLPKCRYGILPAPDAQLGRWQRTLLDTTFALPEGFAPKDLVLVSQAGSPSPELVRSFVIPDLKALLQASEQAGNPVDVLIGYRSYARQQALFQNHLQDEGRTAALASTARPGHSEHQLGTTIDFRTKGQVDVPRNWASEPAGAWMEANAWRFGFIESYPQGEEDTTCYRYEPWHYRYFGRPLAARIHASGLTAREYLWRLDSQQATTGPTTGPSG